jgi:hypothetical protein
MTVRALAGRTPGQQPDRPRSIELGKIAIALPDGTCTFTLDDAGNKGYAGRYQRPRLTTLVANDHTHDIHVDDVPPAGLPCIALFYGPATSDAYVLPIGWP